MEWWSERRGRVMGRERVRVLSVGELAPGRMAFVDIEGLPVALANVAGTITFDAINAMSSAKAAKSA